MTRPVAPKFAVCPDCGGAGIRMEWRAYLPFRSTVLRSKLMPSTCRGCRGGGRYVAPWIWGPLQ